MSIAVEGGNGSVATRSKFQDASYSRHKAPDEKPTVNLAGTSGDPDESRLPNNMLEGECYIPRVRPSAVAVISEDYEFDLIKRRMATIQYSDFDQGFCRLD